jgi:hypothetical protein
MSSTQFMFLIQKDVVGACSLFFDGKTSHLLKPSHPEVPNDR